MPARRCSRHFPTRRSGSIYIVDPLGNLMMRHAPTAAPSKDLLEDLRRLLKLSHIGHRGFPAFSSQPKIPVRNSIRERIRSHKMIDLMMR